MNILALQLSENALFMSDDIGNAGKISPWTQITTGSKEYKSRWIELWIQITLYEI